MRFDRRRCGVRLQRRGKTSGSALDAAVGLRMELSPNGGAAKALEALFSQEFSLRLPGPPPDTWQTTPSVEFADSWPRETISLIVCL